MQEQLEIERMRLAACGVAAMQNTRSTIMDRIANDNPYYSASYSDVCRAVDREIALREKLELVESALSELGGPKYFEEWLKQKGQWIGPYPKMED